MITTRIEIDWGACAGHARCYAVAPGVFHLNAESRAVIRRQPMTASRLDEAERAAMACPERAIQVERAN
jgi:ferredoxin